MSEDQHRNVVTALPSRLVVLSRSDNGWFNLDILVRDGSHEWRTKNVGLTLGEIQAIATMAELSQRA